MIKFCKLFLHIKMQSFFLFSLLAFPLFSGTCMRALFSPPTPGVFLPSQERCMRRAAQPECCKPVYTPGPWCCASLLNNGDKLILETPNCHSSFSSITFQWTGKGWLGYWVGGQAEGRVYCSKERWGAPALSALTHFSPLQYPLWLY